MKRFVAGGVVWVIFSMGYAAAVWGEWPLFTYFPSKKAFGLGPSTAENGVPAIYWYGTVGAAAAIALILSAFVKEPRSSRLWRIVLGAVPYLAMALLAVHEMRWLY